jgi:hypothetical protein
MAVPSLIRPPFNYWCSSSDLLQSVLVCDIWVATGWVCFINLCSVCIFLTCCMKVLQGNRAGTNAQEVEMKTKAARQTMNPII